MMNSDELIQTISHHLAMVQSILLILFESDLKDLEPQAAIVIARHLRIANAAAQQLEQAVLGYKSPKKG